MPVSTPSEFPPHRAGDQIIGLESGQSYVGSNCFLAGQAAGNFSTVTDLIVIGHLDFSAGATDANLQGPTIIGSNAGVNLLSSGTGGAGTLSAYGWLAANALVYGVGNVVIGAKALQYSPGGFSATTSYNVIIGELAGQNLGSVSGNSFVQGAVVIGYGAAQGRLHSLGGSNPCQESVIIGYLAANAQDFLLNTSVVIGGLAGATKLATSENVTNLVLIGGNSDGYTAGNSVFIGAGLTVAGVYQTVIGSGITNIGAEFNVIVGDNANGGNGVNNVLLGSRAGSNNGNFDNRLIIETGNYPSVNPNFRLIAGTFGNETLNACGLILGNSSLAATNDAIPTGSLNTVSLVNGAPGPSGANINGYFYSLLGALHWVDAAGVDNVLTPPGGGGGSPGGSPGQLQYNNAGAFGGTDFLYYAAATPNVLTIGSDSNVNPVLECDPNVQAFGTIGPTLSTPASNNQEGNALGIGGWGYADDSGDFAAAGFVAFEGTFSRGGVNHGGDTIIQGAHGSGNQMVGGAVYISSGASFCNSPVISGNVYITCGPADLVTGAVSSGAQVTGFSLTDGGSGYPDGLWLDYTNNGQLFEFYDLTNTVPDYFSTQWVRVEGGVIVEIGPINYSGQMGVDANIGDVLSLGFFQPYPSYAGSPTPATVTVTSVGSGYNNPSGEIKINPGSSGAYATGFMFNGAGFTLPFNGGQIIDSSSTSGAIGQVFSAGATGDVWSDSGTPQISRDAIIDTGALTIANGITFESLRAAAPLTSFTLTMPATPQDEQQLAIVCNFAIAALTLSPNAGQTIENIPAALVAGQQIIFLYDLATTTWERLQ